MKTKIRYGHDRYYVLEADRKAMYALRVMISHERLMSRIGSAYVLTLAFVLMTALRGIELGTMFGLFAFNLATLAIPHVHYIIDRNRAKEVIEKEAEDG